MNHSHDYDKKMFTSEYSSTAIEYVGEFPVINNLNLNFSFGNRLTGSDSKERSHFSAILGMSQIE